jgi:hypothetical protein
MFEGRFGVSQMGAEYGLRIFHHIKVYFRIGRKDSIQAACQKNEEIGGIFVFSGSKNLKSV